MNVQSNEDGTFLPAHFVENVVPRLLEEVHQYQDPNIQGPPKESGCANRKDPTKKQPGLKCNHCEFVAKNLSGLSTHTRMTHKKEHKSSLINSKQNAVKSNSITVEEFSTKFQLESSNSQSSLVKEVSSPEEQDPNSSPAEELSRLWNTCQTL